MSAIKDVSFAERPRARESMSQQSLTALMPSRPRLSDGFAGFTNFGPAQTPANRPPSMLYSLLPSAVQNRLHRLPSVRTSVSTYGLRWRARPRSMSPAEESGAMVLADLEEVRDCSSEDSEQGHGFGPSEGKTAEPSETRSGIAWKFACQGLSLLSLSITESRNLSQASPFDTSSKDAGGPFVRQLYIHALSYLLRGVPKDLTPDESISIRSALPESMKSPLHIQINNSSSSSSAISYRLPGNTSSQPSLLHRMLASIIVTLFVVVQFFLPYFKVMLKAAWQYERSHRIAEWAVKGCMGTVDTAGKLGVRGVGIGGALWELGLGEVVTWVVEGVSGGVREGVGEGLDRVGVIGNTNRDRNIDMELW